MTDYAHGWYQVAFESDVAAPVTPLVFGGRSLMAVRPEDGRELRVFDAVCPHRGAHLGYGGRLAGETVVCPFHGHRIGLGRDGPDGFCAREYACLARGGGVFVRLSDRAAPDLPRGLEELGRGHTFVPGFEMTAATSIEVVIENGFDGGHFPTVHGLLSSPGLTIRTGPFGELAADGWFQIPADGQGGQGGRLQARYTGHAFSPGLFVSELDGGSAFRYRVMTAATPDHSARSCTIRLTLMVPSSEGGPADGTFVRQVLDYSRDGLEKDRAIWERLDLSHPARLTPRDEPIVAFGEFCRDFRQPPERRP